MITVSPSKHGRAGDLLLATTPAPLAVSALDRPDTRFTGGGSYSLGLQLIDDDLRATADAMRRAFKQAYPHLDGRLKLPIRRSRNGVWLLFAETMKSPVILDAEGRPVPPPPLGSPVRLFGRICPFHRPDRNVQGVALYANKIQLAPISASPPRPLVQELPP